MFLVGCKLLAARSAQPLRHTYRSLSCVAASACQSYNLNAAARLLGPSRVHTIENGEALHARVGNADIFVLGGGSLVGWDLSEEELVRDVVPLLRDAEVEPLKMVETEDMDYTEVESAKEGSGMEGDEIVLRGSLESRLLDKLAFSSGLARSTRLSALEASVEQILAEMKDISSSMAGGKRPHYSVKQVDILTGRLLQLRGTLNLHSNITETPDLYWSHPTQEKLFKLISRKLDVEPRISLLNRKLDYAADAVKVLRQNLSERISLRVEWMILMLILVEVAIELKKFIPEIL